VLVGPFYSPHCAVLRIEDVLDGYFLYKVVQTFLKKYLKF